MARVLKPFLFGGRVVQVNEDIKTDAAHHDQLAAGGLVAPRKGKKAPASAPASDILTARKRPARSRPILGK